MTVSCILNNEEYSKIRIDLVQNKAKFYFHAELTTKLNTFNTAILYFQGNMVLSDIEKPIQKPFCDMILRLIMDGKASFKITNHNHKLSVEILPNNIVEDDAAVPESARF